MPSAASSWWNARWSNRRSESSIPRNRQPSLRLAYRSGRSLSPGGEYYSELGSLSGGLPTSQQTHQIYPTIDWTLNPNVRRHFGVGVGLTPAGEQLMYKTRIEVSLGRKTH